MRNGEGGGGGGGGGEREGERERERKKGRERSVDQLYTQKPCHASYIYISCTYFVL